MILDTIMESLHFHFMFKRHWCGWQERKLGIMNHREEVHQFFRTCHTCHIMNAIRDVVYAKNQFKIVNL